MNERTRVVEFEWAQKQDLSEFEGEWVLVFENKVLAHGRDVKQIISEFRKSHPGKRPFLMRINSEQLALW